MSVVYVDTSALLKRVVPEAGSREVIADLERRVAQGDLLSASSLAWLETWRALRRRSAPDLDALFGRAVSGIAEFPMDQAVLRAARSVGNDSLRSLDAIHLVSAMMVGADSIMTFDTRLAEAGRASGMAVLQPAQSSPDSSQS